MRTLTINQVTEIIELKRQREVKEIERCTLNAEPAYRFLLVGETEHEIKDVYNLQIWIGINERTYNHLKNKQVTA